MNKKERTLSVRDELTDFLLYTAPEGQVKVECVLHNETIWLPQKKIAELFDVGVPAISKHLKNIFESAELQEKVVVSILETTTQHGAIKGKNQTQSTKFYNLDAIISVGYRVNSSRATQFRNRTIDQMVQAARSGKQNIIEGSMASGTSKETEIKLTNVARASLEELLEDYRDFLRTRQTEEWDKNSKEALFVRKLASGKIQLKENGSKNGTQATNATDEKKDTSPLSSTSHPITYETFRSFEDRPPEVRANIAICLVHQTNYLLDQQLRKLEQDFLNEGGLRERMYRARTQARNTQH